MKINVNVEKLISGITSSIRFNYSYNDIKHCDVYPRENLITFKIEMEQLSIFNYLSRDEAEELYNKLFVKDGRILRGLKEFAEVHYFEDAAIELHNKCFGTPKPMLLLYQSEDWYVEQVIKEYCYHIKYGAKIYDPTIPEINLSGISEYFVPGDKYAYALHDDRILKEKKSLANKYGYGDAMIFSPLTLLLYDKNIDINKK